MDYEYCCGRYIPGQEIIRILPTVVLGYFDTMVRIAHVSCQVSSQFSMTRLKDIANCKATSQQIDEYAAITRKGGNGHSEYFKTLQFRSDMGGIGFALAPVYFVQM
jgi:hypothetical protein